MCFVKPHPEAARRVVDSAVVKMGESSISATGCVFVPSRPWVVRWRLSAAHVARCDRLVVCRGACLETRRAMWRHSDPRARIGTAAAFDFRILVERRAAVDPMRSLGPNPTLSDGPPAPHSSQSAYRSRPRPKRSTQPKIGSSARPKVPSRAGSRFADRAVADELRRHDSAIAWRGSRRADRRRPLPAGVVESFETEADGRRANIIAPRSEPPVRPAARHLGKAFEMQ